VGLGQGERHCQRDGRRIAKKVAGRTSSGTIQVREADTTALTVGYYVEPWPFIPEASRPPIRIRTNEHPMRPTQLLLAFDRKFPQHEDLGV
jgi:hypothetical protein